MPNSV